MATENGMTVWSAVLMTAILLAFIKDALLLNVGEFDFSSDVEVCDISPESLFGDGLWVPPVHKVQNTVSHVSQNSSSYECNQTLGIEAIIISHWVMIISDLIIIKCRITRMKPTWLWWVEHFGMTSRRCRAIRSSNWFTRKEGGRAWTPPRGIVINSRHIGHRNWPVSRANVATILSKHCMHTVWEHGISFGLCSPPSYMP